MGLEREGESEVRDSGERVRVGVKMRGESGVRERMIERVWESGVRESEVREWRE